MADLKEGYQGSSTALTVTALQSLASSQDWTAGWGSASISNISNLYADILAGFTFTTHASNRQAGLINIYVIPAMDTTPTYPAASSGTIGTEGAIAFTDTEERDAACNLVASFAVDATASSVISTAKYLSQALGKIPGNFVIFIAHNCTTTTTAGLASSGNAISTTGQYKTY